MRTLTIVMLLALMAAPLIAEEVTITGRVVGPDGEAIEGAAVGARYYGATDMDWARATSAADGRFTLQFDPRQPFDEYQVVALADGFAVGYAMVQGGGEAEIALPPQAEPITGTVLGDAGEPIAGAEVTLTWLRALDDERFARVIIVDTEFAPPVASDAEGRFAITIVPAGYRSSLRVEAEGYAFYYSLSSEQWPTPGEDMQITLPDEAIIAGRVLRDGEGAEGLRVIASAGPPGHGSGTAITGADGGYEIHSLPTGEYKVQVSPPRDRTALPIDGVELAAGERADGVDIELIEGGLVRGTVTWAGTGEAIPDAHVWAHDLKYSWDYAANTDEDGVYELRLPPGAAQIKWSYAPDEARSATTDRVDIAISPEQVATADFRLLRKRTIDLIVLSPDGTPAGGAAVYWYGDKRRSIGHNDPQMTDEQGRATLTYARGVEDRQPLTPIIAGDAERDLCGLELIDGEAATEATVRLKPAAYVTVTVQSQDGAPVSEGDIWVRVPNHGPTLPIDAELGEDGRGRLGPLPGGIELVLSTGLRDVLIEPRVETVEAPFTLEPGETRELEPWIVAPDGLTLRGLVVDGDGDPVEGATVLCDRTVNRGQEPARALTGADGRFELERLSATGDYLVVAVGPESRTAFAQPVDPRVAYEPTFALLPLGELDVTVVDDGQPVPDAQVHLSGSGLMYNLLPEEFTTDAQATPDAEGRLQFSGLIPGIQYSVIALIGSREDPELVGVVKPTLLADEGHAEVTIEMMTLPEAQEHFRQ